MRIFLVSLVLLALSGCQTIEERFAVRTGCKMETVTVQQTSWSPVHQNHLVKCGTEKKEYLCTDTSFSNTCFEKKTGDEAAKPAEAPKK